MPRRPLFLTVACAGLLALGGLAGCDSTEISPLSFMPFEAENGLYGVYGYLEAGTFTQTVRVTPLRTDVGRPTDPMDARLPVRVFSRRLGAPDSVEWAQGVVAFADSTYSATFTTNAVAPRPGETYTLTILRTDGQTTTATTAIPAAPSFRQEAPMVADGAVTLPLVFGGDYPLSHAEVVYRIPAYQFNGNPFPLDYPQPGEGTPTRLDLDLSAAIPLLRAAEPQWLSEELEPLIPLIEATARVYVTSTSTRPSPGDVQTDTIENGTGWWVGLNRASFPLEIDAGTLNEAGFCAFPGDPACRACLIYDPDPRPRCN